MTFRLLAPVVFVAFLVDAAGLTSTQPQVDYGDFVYETEDPGHIKMIFNATKDGKGRFYIECTGGKYEDAWFPLRKTPNPVIMHEFPYNKGVVPARLQKWHREIQKLCPYIKGDRYDLWLWYVHPNGNLETKFNDASISLERQWLSMSTGTYKTNTSDLKLEAIVTKGGLIDVKISCKEGDTGCFLYGLRRSGPYERYKLSTLPDGKTVKDLVDKFQKTCPRYAHFFNEQKLETVGFATPNMVFGPPVFIYNRLYRQSAWCIPQQ
ncbi:hypothetical protein FOZ63_012538 [Perkinsus olseni]|uniref:Uncharacterized protein n=1 Tax=Perkinsus olseni TaxID=32597 RepID=A0A7J6PD02_PEROL|nr:hypothetical protein FOZ60_011103 [Perkinsus olseni]KAF4693872.1 hypothetical protein FOZ62_008544 [Perkinsus olseni]KAF4704457.1 hypothetical protein FOZ63_012538 [Perkinsus olseni]